MRVMALDIGEKRIGVAISDPEGAIASPLCVMPADEVRQNAPTWRRLLGDWEPDMILSGLPYTMAGEEGPQAGRIRENARTIAKCANLPLSFIDERLSSQEAKRILREKGLSEKDMRGKIDMIAASLFLQTWLDEQR